MNEAGLSHTNYPGNAARSGGPGWGNTPPSGNPRDNPLASPLHSLITPEITIPFGCNCLPGPDAGNGNNISAANVGYFGLQLLDGNAHGIAKLCGINFWIGSTLNGFYTTTFPVRPVWNGTTTLPEQIASYGNPLGTGAGLIVALSNDLPFQPVAGGWVGGPPLYPWLMPSEQRFLNNPNGNRQIWGTPFAPGSQDEDHVNTKEGTLRDTPLGWDVPKTSTVWVLIAIDGSACVQLGDAGNGIYVPCSGNIIAAADRRRFTLS